MKSKRILIAEVFALFIFACLMMPHWPQEMGGFAENLWTAEGFFHKTAASNECEDWTRIACGRPYTWFMIDIGKSVDAWYARFDIFVLGLYVVSSFVAGMVALGALLALRELGLYLKLSRASE